MLVVIARSIPPAVRGRMKLWFVEPRPNVFISGISDSVASDVVEYLFSHCPSESNLMVFKKTSAPPGYEIRGFGVPEKPVKVFQGLQLIVEKIIENTPPPPIVLPKT